MLCQLLGSKFPSKAASNSSLTVSVSKGVKDSQRGQLGNSAASVGSFRGIRPEDEEVCKVHGDFV